MCSIKIKQNIIALFLTFACFAVFAQTQGRNDSGVIVIDGYVADSDNVQDIHQHYGNLPPTTDSDSWSHLNKDYSNHPDEYNYYSESSYFRGYEDSFRAFGAGANHGGAGANAGGGRH